MKIHKLAQQEAQKIAAGEVVERPANSIKELIENSLDAGATHITLELEDGGKQKIAVIDNGCGMNVEDARICFERHTTSKLQTVDQLDSINTFGFRGEALASICSVAQVTVITKSDEQLEGLQLSIEQGHIQEAKTVSRQTGTTVVVDNLFYNVPARKKFLKSTSTEFNQINTLFKGFALTHSNVHFILQHNGQVTYNCPPVTTVRERMEQLFEPAVAHSCINLESAEKEGIKIAGIISSHQYSRYDKNALFFVVNNRLVKNFHLVNAVKKGYLNSLPAGKYPAGVIILTINPKTVDINVHPKKDEVQFLHQRLVDQLITQAVTKTLEQHLSARLQKPVQLQNPEPSYFLPPDPFVFPDVPVYQKVPDLFIPVTQKEAPVVQKVILNTDQQEQVSTLQEKKYQLIGQYKSTYLLLESQEGLIVVDQHAAHERILYERFKKRFTDSVATIGLLFPQIITVSENVMQLLVNYLHIFHQFSVEIEPIGSHQLIIKATPVFLKECNFVELIEQVVSWIKEIESVNIQDFEEIITKKLRAQMACKAAVKAGDQLTLVTMEQLLTDLETTENRTTCPHGRPTSWCISLDEIERKFKRKR